MGSILELARQAWSDYIIPGVSSTGVNNPRKDYIDATFVEVDSKVSSLEIARDGIEARVTTAEGDIVTLEASISGLSSGRIARATQAVLFGELGWDANTLATVVSDADPAKRGDYIKVGASGTGSWSGPTAVNTGSGSFTTLSSTTSTLATFSSTNGTVTNATLTNATMGDAIVAGAGTVSFSMRPQGAAADRYEIFQDSSLAVTERLFIGSTLTTVARLRATGEYQFIFEPVVGNDQFKVFHEGRLPSQAKLTATSNEIARMWAAVPEQYVEDYDAVTINNGAAPYIASFGNKARNISVRSTTGFVDVSFLNTGVPVVIACTETPSNSVCRIYAGTQGKFRGITNKVVQIASGSTVRIICVDDSKTGANYNKEFSLEVVEGSVNTTTASQTLPIYSKTFAVAGQSLFKRCLEGSFMSAFQQRLSDLGLARDVYPISGAVGSTGLFKGSSTAGYWWDQDTNSLSSLSTDLVARIQAAITAGQPQPAVCFWNIGQADSNVVSTAGVLTYDTYRAVMVQWATAMNAALGFSMKYIIPPLGSEDILATVSSPTRTGDQRYTTLRAAMCRACVDNPTLFEQGPDWYDTLAGVERVWNDAHPTLHGQIIFANRCADQWANIVYGQTNDLGPRVISWTQNTTTTFTARVQYSGGLSRPAETLIPRYVKLLPAGTPGPEVAPIEVTKMDYVNAGAGLLDITFTIASPSAGARFVFPYGAAPGARETLGFYGSANDYKPLRSCFF